MQPEVEGLVDAVIAALGTPSPLAAQGGPARMTGALHPYDRLFAPLAVNRLTLRNRIAMAPMGNLGMADAAGRPSAKMIAYLAERARGGAGLITTGLVPVSPDTDPAVPRSAAFPRIGGTREVLAGWRDLAAAVHAHGAHLFIQLSAGLGRVGSPECLQHDWRLPVSASWTRNFYVPQVPCRPLTDRECRRIVRDLGQAAADAQACGIDGIHLHGHEGYLLEQFANPAFNRRSFGRYADWQAMGLDSVAEVRRRCGPDMPIMYRLDLSLALRATYGSRMDAEPALRRFRGERSVAMSLAYIGALVAAGVDMIDVDLGCYENWWLPHPPGGMPPGPFLPVARAVKAHLAARERRSAAAHPVPVAAVGKLGYPDLAEAALRDGDCDLVMLGRPLLADPDWPRKARAGLLKAIVPCIGDHEACLNEIIHGGHIQCAVNPRTGFEDGMPARPAPAERRRRIAVVGAGPAGITCACLAAERGHAVVLFERAERPGGWLRAGSAPAMKFDVANYLTHLEHRLAEAADRHGLDIRLGQEIGPEALAAGGFDAVICCTGSRPALPRFAETAGSRAIQATAVLSDPSLADAARDIVVVGGGDVGCETAHMLAMERGKRVTVLEAGPHFMPTACAANRGFLIHQLERHGVALLNGTRVVRVTERGVTAMRNLARGTPVPGAVWQPLLPPNVPNPFARAIGVEEHAIEIPADLVLVAVGQVPEDGLSRACMAGAVAPEIHNIGDSFRVGRVFDATRAGYAVGAAL